MFIYFLSDWGRIFNFSGPSYLEVLKLLHSKAQFRWCKLGSSPFFFLLKEGKPILVYYCGWPKERSCPALTEACEDNGALCTLIFIFPASRRWPGADTEGEWTQGGQWGTVNWGESTTFTGYPGTLIALAALKLGFFFWETDFKSTQCGLGCLHSGVSRTLELYLKGIVLMFCVFLSDSPNTRQFGIILDLE